MTFSFFRHCEECVARRGNPPERCEQQLLRGNLIELFAFVI
jgi:hypothetical protein